MRQGADRSGEVRSGQVRSDGTRTPITDRVIAITWLIAIKEDFRIVHGNGVLLIISLMQL